MSTSKPPSAMAVRTIDLSQPLSPLTDVTEYARTRIFVGVNGRLIGQVDIANHYQPISASRLRDEIIEEFSDELLKKFVGEYFDRNGELPEPVEARMSSDIPVSIVVATYDRPNDLRKCLNSLLAQESPREVEVIVVDNNPPSGLTPAVLADYPGVVLINETRKGLSYARNQGILASNGEIIVATDDDVTMPADWLEKLLAPFANPNVYAATGNVLPLEIETEAQYLFEVYGGLGRGFTPRTVDRQWFDMFRSGVKTWELGATANAAFRAAIFCHPEIGLLDEALGAGTPTGCSEDTYLFYKLLKAGYAIAYEPAAYVWHRHRREDRAFRQQIFNYSKGHVAYHLTTFIRDHDKRALIRLLVSLPKIYFDRIKERLFGRSDYPLSMILLEIAGNLSGPWALWRSRRRVKRLGHSDPYLPVSQRQYPATQPASVQTSCARQRG